MIVGVPREIKDNEYRVSMTPGGVCQLIEAGHEVCVETGAGEGSGFPDTQYSSFGARIVPTAEEAWAAEMVVKVKEPQPSEYPFLRSDLTLFTYLHLAADKDVTLEMAERGVTGIAYETVETQNGRLPLLTPMSEIAGRMAIQIGAHFMEKMNGVLSNVSMRWPWPRCWSRTRRYKKRRSSMNPICFLAVERSTSWSTAA